MDYDIKKPYRVYSWERNQNGTPMNKEQFSTKAAAVRHAKRCKATGRFQSGEIVHAFTGELIWKWEA